jgi:hypothetical protein
MENNSEHSFIPRLWAYTRINDLLDEIKVVGKDESLIGEIVTLATEYQFVTPYTSLLITVEEPEDEEPPNQGEDPGGVKEEEKEPPTTSTGGTTSTHSAPDDSDGNGIPDDTDSYPYDPLTKPKKTSAKDDSGGGGFLFGEGDDEKGSGLKASEANMTLVCLPILAIGILLIAAIIIGVTKKMKNNRKN